MKQLPTLELKWGVMIGLINLLWLYLSYYLGLHTSGIQIFQVVPLVWFIITLIGMWLALHDLRRKRQPFSYLQGFFSGGLIALITALIAILMQVGYYQLIHPEWPDYMAEQTRIYFATQGRSATEIEAMVEQARSTFTMTNYAMQSAISALVAGLGLAAIMMIFLRDRRGLGKSQ